MDQDIITEVLALLAAGNYWPALAVLLLGLTAAVRHAGGDAWLERRGLSRHARAWVPVLLAGAAWSIAMVSPWRPDAGEAAYTALLAALGAIGLHDAGKAAGAVKRARGRSRARMRAAID
jgi:hypothetical protein